MQAARNGRSSAALPTPDAALPRPNPDKPHVPSHENAAARSAGGTAITTLSCSSASRGPVRHPKNRYEPTRPTVPKVAAGRPSAGSASVSTRNSPAAHPEKATSLRARTFGDTSRRPAMAPATTAPTPTTASSTPARPGAAASDASNPAVATMLPTPVDAQKAIAQVSNSLVRCVTARRCSPARAPRARTRDGSPRLPTTSGSDATMSAAEPDRVVKANAATRGPRSSPLH